MIQKIRILHKEQRNNIAEYPADSSLPSTTNKARQQLQVCRYERNGNVVGVTQSLIKTRSADRGKHCYDKIYSNNCAVYHNHKMAHYDNLNI